jgi:hypothetical protein
MRTTDFVNIARLGAAMNELPDRLPRTVDERGNAEPVNLREYVLGHLYLHNLLPWPEEAEEES